MAGWESEKWTPEMVGKLKEGRQITFECGTSKEVHGPFALQVERGGDLSWWVAGGFMIYNNKEERAGAGIRNLKFVDEEISEPRMVGYAEGVIERRIEAARFEERARAAEELAELKGRMGLRFKELADEHGWCSVAQEAAAEFDLPWPDDRHKMTLTLEVDVEAVRVGGVPSNYSSLAHFLEVSFNPSETGDTTLDLGPDSDLDETRILDVRVYGVTLEGEEVV